MPHTRSVSICIFVGTGSRYESDQEAGISHFIEHLLFRGSAKRPSSQAISVAIEGVGGILNAATDRELTVYWCKVAQNHFALALDVLTDMLLNARIDAADIEKERGVIVEEINMSLDSPSQRVGMLMDELLWSGHPLGRDVAGTKESIRSITREMILNYQSNRYLPANTVVSIAGNISHDAAVNEVEKLLGGWSNKKERPPYLAYESRSGPRVRIEKRDIEEAHLSLALPGLSLFHPNRFNLGLLNAVLGSGMSSRLFTEIRDRLGLVYNIHSYPEFLCDTGAFIIGAGVDPRNLNTAIAAILEQLAKLKELIPEWELTKGKEISKGHLLLRLEETRSTASWVGVQEVLTGDALTIDRVLANIDAAAAVELRRLSRELLVADRLRLAVVGPVAEDEPLEKLLKI
jgi:predicted Zn-dependent peptidase